MRRHSFGQIHLTKEAEDRAYELALSVEDYFLNTYGFDRGAHGCAHALVQLRYVLAAKPDLEGVTFLELGCGSVESLDKTSSGFKADYEPWLCRALQRISKEGGLGMRVIGVDIAPLGREPFEGYRADLLSPDSLGFLKDDEVDVAYTHNFFSSPSFWGAERARGVDAQELLFPQLERIVKPDGVFMYDA